MASVFEGEREVSGEESFYGAGESYRASVFGRWQRSHQSSGAGCPRCDETESGINETHPRDSQARPRGGEARTTSHESEPERHGAGPSEPRSLEAGIEPPTRSERSEFERYRRGSASTDRACRAGVYSLRIVHPVFASMSSIAAVARVQAEQWGCTSLTNITRKLRCLQPRFAGDNRNDQEFRALCLSSHRSRRCPA